MKEVDACSGQRKEGQEIMECVHVHSEQVMKGNVGQRSPTGHILGANTEKQSRNWTVRPLLRSVPRSFHHQVSRQPQPLNFLCYTSHHPLPNYLELGSSPFSHFLTTAHGPMTTFSFITLRKGFKVLLLLLYMSMRD